VNLREWFKPHCIHRTWRELPIDQSGDWLEVSSHSICTDCGTHHVEFQIPDWELPEFGQPEDRRGMRELAEATGISEESLRNLKTVAEGYDRSDA